MAEESNGAVNKQIGSKKYIKKSMRTAIKVMAYMNNIARCVELMPKPEDFAQRVANESIILLGKVNLLSNRINELCQSYTNLPTDYLTNTMNNVMDTATRWTTDVETQVAAVGHTVDNVKDIVSSVNKVSDSVDSLNNYIDDVNNSGVGNAVMSTVSGIENTSASITSSMDSVKNNILDKVNDINERLETARKKFDDVLGAFVPKIDEKASESDSGTVAGDLLTTSTETFSNIVKNFNIVSISTGLVGMATSFGLIYAGLDNLPKIDVSSAFDFGRTKKVLSNIKNDDCIIYEPSEAYNKLRESLEVDFKKERERIRNKRSSSISEVRKQLTPEEQQLIHQSKITVAKEIQKKKKQAKLAKATEKTTGVIKKELDMFKKDVTKFSDNISNDWNSMMYLYKDALDETKKFFTGEFNDSEGSKYIDECCDKIEQDCINIVESCKNLKTIITEMTIVLPQPWAIGTVFPNMMVNMANWFKDMKLVFIEIKKIIGYGIDIVKQVNNLAQIMLTGINSMKDIKDKLMEILSIKWLIDFIDEMIEFITGKALEGKELIENTLSPIYYKDTEYYDNEMEKLENLLDGGTSNSNITIRNYYYNKNDVKKTDSVTIKMKDGKPKNDDEYDKIEDAIDLLEEKGETVVYAYKSPILNESGDDFIGWIYYHAQIDGKYDSNRGKRRSRRIIKKAAKKSHKKNGGVNRLKSTKVNKMSSDFNGTNRPKAYDAFYWKTVMTNDMTVDGFDGVGLDNTVSSITTTEQGTLVQLEDGRRVFVNAHGIKPGDYVLVEGKRYRVQ